MPMHSLHCKLPWPFSIFVAFTRMTQDLARNLRPDPALNRMGGAGASGHRDLFHVARLLHALRQVRQRLLDLVHQDQAQIAGLQAF